MLDRLIGRVRTVVPGDVNRTQVGDVHRLLLVDPSLGFIYEAGERVAATRGRSGAKVAYA